MGWPWEPRWWKPKDVLTDLIRAGALCLAEADRARRAHAPIRESRESYDAGQPATLKLVGILGDIQLVLSALNLTPATARGGEPQQPSGDRVDILMPPEARHD